MHNLKNIYSGIKGIIRYEGVKGLISKGFIFLFHRIIFIRDYYVILTDMVNTPEDKEADFKPETDDYCVKIISTNREADALAASGYEMGAYELDLRASLDKSATVFCIFIGKELAHIVTAADNPQGRNVADPRPFNVDFNHGEIVTGRALTIPKFRRLHLRLYSGYVLRKYYWERGVRWIKGTMGAHNYAPLAAMAQNIHTNHTVVSKCRYIKIFCFEYLKEEKMEPIPARQLFQQKYNHSKSKSRKLNIAKDKN